VPAAVAGLAFPSEAYAGENAAARRNEVAAGGEAGAHSPSPLVSSLTRAIRHPALAIRGAEEAARG
jgi:fructose-bisphosphate aldolase class 1